MANHKTHTERKFERAQRRKLERKKNRQPGHSDSKFQDDIPLVNVRIALSAVLALLTVVLALKAFEFPVPNTEEPTVINLSGAGIDDANIFFTYAKNVVEGHGAVYYSGGDPVEGYSSTLFMLLCAVGMLVTENIEFFVLLVNAILMCGVLMSLQFFLHGLAKESLPEDTPITKRELLVVNWAASALLWAWVVVSPAYVIWATVTLMDVGLWAFVFVSGSLAVVRKALRSNGTSRSLNLWILLLLLTRPEAFYLCLVWLFVIVVTRVKQGSRIIPAVKSIKGSILYYFAVVGVITAWRYLYFGYPFPNTYYAKVSSDFFYNLKLGVGYLIEFVKAEPWAGVALLMNAVLVLQTFRVPWNTDQPVGSKPIAIISLITLLACISPILTGGDHFNYFRFFQPYWPLMALAPLYYFRKYFLIASLPTMRKPLRVGLSTAALIGTMLLAQTPPWSVLLRTNGIVRPTLTNEFQLALGGRQLGELLNAWNAELQLNNDSKQQAFSLGTLTTGGIGYTYKGPVLDMLGLNNVQMAHRQGDRKGNKNHAAFNKDIFFAQSPDLFAPRSENKIIQTRNDVFPFNVGNEFWVTALKGLGTDLRFLDLYAPIEITQREENGGLIGRCTVWVKKSLLDSILNKETNYFSVTVLPEAST
ncbi:MAG: hypothetical protein VX876_07095 [Planctomycetota bacterium]|nr:hypothetical protein [Planctomycetota bacterium]